MVYRCVVSPSRKCDGCMECKQYNHHAMNEMETVEKEGAEDGRQCFSKTFERAI